MPIQKKWTRFTSENIKALPDKPGVYELANSERRIIDIGGSNSSIRNRLASHLRDNKYPTAKYFRYEPEGFWSSGIDKETSHSKKFQEKHGRKPRYTKRSPSDLPWYLSHR